MKKFIVLILAILFATPVFAAAGDLFSVETSGAQEIRIDQDGQMIGLLADIETISTDDTLTAAESGRTYILAPAIANRITVTLPSAAAGLTYTFINATTQIGYIDPASTDRIGYLTLAAGDKLQTPSTTAIGSPVTLVASDDTVWAVRSMVGTWQDGN